MDSADAAAPLAAWASIRGYFTPATLFLVVNLVIGTIALTSCATQQRRRRGQQQHYYHDDGHGHEHYHLQQEPLHPHLQQQQPAYGDHYYQQPQQQQLYATPPAPAPLARTSSVLDRLRSFGLYRFCSGDFPPEYGAAAGPTNHAQDAFAPVEEETTTAAQQPEAHYARSRSEPAPAREERRPPASRMKKSGSEVRKAQVARAPATARVVEAVAEDDSADARAEDFTVSFRREREPSPQLQQEYNYQEEYVPPPARPRPPAPAPAAPAPLARTPSVMYRLRSLGLYGFLAPEQPAAASIPATDSFVTPAAAEKKQAHAHEHYDRSRSEPASVQGGNKKEKPQEAKQKMAKSSSEARKTPAPRPAEAAALAGQSVDARAEAFIDSFKQQQARHHQEEEEEEYVPPLRPAPLARAPSVLERLRSFGLSRFRSGDLGPDLPAADEKNQQAAAHYGRSRAEPAREQGKKESRVSKSSSSVEEEPAGAEHGVDARADDFINKFRQQLQLQRLNSLLGGGGGKQ